jgi:signal transduction histidine kinase
VEVPFHAIHDPEQLEALLDAVLALESAQGLSGVLQRIVEAACTLTGARYGALAVLDPSGRGLSDFVHFGMDEATVAGIGHPPTGEGILGLLILDPAIVRLADLTAHPDAVGLPEGHPAMHSFLGLALRAGDEVLGNLYVTEKDGGGEFDDMDAKLLASLAAAAAIAVYNARLHDRIGELTVAADRERIARDLHDTVIQRLFATGLSLQLALPRADVDELRRRIDEAVSDLDDIIRQVRTTIFALEPPPSSERGLRARVIGISAESARSLGFEPEVRFVGPIDRLVSDDIAVELLSCLREALSNVARHASARRVQVELSVSDVVRLLVIDDGVGLGKGRHARGQGIANMVGRAESLGGSCRLNHLPDGGTEVSWRVPLTRTAVRS